MLKYILLFVFGAISGVLGGMGMGGGTLLIPLITIFSGIEQHQAQLYNLTAFIPMAAISLFIHGRNGLIKKDGLLPIILPALIFAIVASFFASFTSGDVLKRIFGGFLIVIAVVTVASAIGKTRQADTE